MVPYNLTGMAFPSLWGAGGIKKYIDYSLQKLLFNFLGRQAIFLYSMSLLSNFINAYRHFHYF